MGDPIHGILSPTIYNVQMTNADQEYSQVLPDSTGAILIKLRSTDAILKICFIEGQSGSTYITIPAGCVKSIESSFLNGSTLYFQSPSASQVVEIETWI